MTATCNHCDSTYRGVDRDEDGAPFIEATRCAHPGCEVYLCRGNCQELSFACEGCRRRHCNEHKTMLDGIPYCIACAVIEVEAQEPQCECAQDDVDLFNASGCPLHDSRSWWNVRLRAVSAVQQYNDRTA